LFLHFKLYFYFIKYGPKNVSNNKITKHGDG